MDAACHTYSLEIASTVDRIREVESFLNTLRADCTLTEQLYSNMLVTLTEAVNNAIIHGNKKNARKQVKIDAIYHDKYFMFVIEDEGEGFDCRYTVDPTRPENLWNLSGRGVFLMRKLADNIVFSKKGRCVKLLFFEQNKN